ncbi:testicular haploid expressed gene protein isoform X2 [Meles meles]|uniref:testicular haploid expressed gene protein isoform X2 n=1 Tax=Meles meles TaxID=9662 RepID=UPI001E6A075D|nr:testicular haploid expressed gene protein isoform X2 [Meles meles]
MRTLHYGNDCLALTSSEAEGSPHRGQDNGVLGTGTQDTVSGSRRATDAGKLRFEGQDEDALPEEVTGGEVPSPQRPDAALTRLDGGPEKDVDEGVSEMSRLSISQRFPSVSSVRGRKRRRLSELAKPKTNWQVLKDRPSVYWTERFLEDTTLTITVPEVSRRVEELARPKRFYSEYYNNNRITPIWPVPRSSLEHHASTRLRELAAPRIRNNIWSINMSESSPPRLEATVSGPHSHVSPFPECREKGVPGLQGSPDGRPQPEGPTAGRAQVPRHPVGRVGPHAQTQAARVRLQSPPSLGHAAWEEARGTRVRLRQAVLSRSHHTSDTHACVPPCPRRTRTWTRVDRARQGAVRRPLSCSRLAPLWPWPPPSGETVQCPRPSPTSVFLTEIHAGRCWTSPRRQWPVPGSSPWPSPKCARTSTRATTPITFPRRPWWLGHPVACMSSPPPRASPRKCERPRPGL